MLLVGDFMRTLILSECVGAVEYVGARATKQHTLSARHAAIDHVKALFELSQAQLFFRFRTRQTNWDRSADMDCMDVVPVTYCVMRGLNVDHRPAGRLLDTYLR